MPPDLPMVRKWLQKAQRDLELSHLAEERETIAELACFHCQQAVEKALKAFLEFKGVRPPKTHSLAELLDEAERLDARYGELPDVEWLTQFAVTVRYPDVELRVTAEHVQKGLAVAEHIFCFVGQSVPPEARP